MNRMHRNTASGRKLHWRLLAPSCASWTCISRKPIKFGPEPTEKNIKTKVRRKEGRKEEIKIFVRVSYKQKAIKTRKKQGKARKMKWGSGSGLDLASLHENCLPSTLFCRYHVDQCQTRVASAQSSLSGLSQEIL